MNRNMTEVDNELDNHGHKNDKYLLIYKDENTIMINGLPDETNNIYLSFEGRQWKFSKIEIDLSKVGYNGVLTGSIINGIEIYAFFNNTGTKLLGFAAIPLGNDPSTISNKYKRLYFPYDPNYKNYIINGNFNIWQEGTTFTSIAHNAYSAEMFKYCKSGIMVSDITRDPKIPNNNSKYSLKIKMTTADTSIAAGEYNFLATFIEGYNFLPLIGKQVILSFWVYSNKTGQYSIALRNSGIDRSYIIPFNINKVDTWEHKYLTINFNYNGGTWDYINGVGLYIDLVLSVGSTFQTTDTEEWISGNYLGTSNNVNFNDNTANYLYLSQMQLIGGNIAIPFQDRKIQDEIELCQRYFEKSYNINVVPGTADVKSCKLSIAVLSTAYHGMMQIEFCVRKRVTPTIVWYSVQAVPNKDYIDVGGSKRAVSDTLYEGETSTGMPVIVAYGSLGDTLSAQWTSNARV